MDKPPATDDETLGAVLDDILTPDKQPPHERTGQDEHTLHLGLCISGRPRTAVWRLFREDGHWVARNDALDIEVEAKTHNQATAKAASSLYDWLIARGLCPALDVPFVDILRQDAELGPRSRDLYDESPAELPDWRRCEPLTSGVLDGGRPIVAPDHGRMPTDEGIFGVDDLGRWVTSPEDSDLLQSSNAEDAVFLPENRPLDPVICDQILARMTEPRARGRAWTLSDLVVDMVMQPRRGEGATRANIGLTLHDVEVALEHLLASGLIRQVDDSTLPARYELVPEAAEEAAT